MNLRRATILGATILAMLVAKQAVYAQQKRLDLDRGRAEVMLQVIRDEIKRHYYDPQLHGLDLDALYKSYDEKIKQAPNLGAAFTDIAAFLSALHDSHTYFFPPLRSAIFDYGFRMQMIGDRAYVIDVRPGSDAAAKLVPGDEILKLNHYSVNRKDFRDLTYYLYTLSPQTAIAFDLRDPSGNPRYVTVQTRKEERETGSFWNDQDVWQFIRTKEARERLQRQRWYEAGDVLIWKMPVFSQNKAAADRMIGKARKHGTLILDLRGNPGGSAETTESLVGSLMDHDVTIATRVSRNPEKPSLARTGGKDAFTGKLIVLVDSRSSSASEMVARLIQLEHRGTVVGDRTAGLVRESHLYPENESAGGPPLYAVAITEAELVMTDGKSLEGVGVTPDVIVLPTAADLAAGRDPALAKAAQLAGVALDPVAAGKLFPFEWTPLPAE